ncbi:hypothetical protein [Metallosphaera hakonensis]|uniref:hypothetical protein n=1 Tax=Metallosphaera hakonensis TaxID=79601 RepID=UPI000B158B1D|nr:hypothetical protein [Metallosphaera hakonensis]
MEKLGIGKDRNLGYGKFIVKEIKDYDLNLGNRRYRYLTGRAYPEGEFMTDRFDRVQMMGGDISPVLLPLLVLLPTGSLVKNVKRLYLEKGENVVVVDPMVL